MRFGINAICIEKKISRCAVVLLAAVILASFNQAFALTEELSQPEIIAAAVKALRNQDFILSQVQVIYDRNNHLWRERLYKMPETIKKKIPKLSGKEFMKKYQAVFFGFTDPPGEVWVFVDRYSGRIFDIYRPKFCEKQ